jgi:hypothetical protein
VRNGETGLVLKPDSKAGYARVDLMLSGGAKAKKLVHVLVLEAFEGPCPAGMECRHYNGVRGDNRWPVNLRWGTKSENAADRRRHDFPRARGASKLAESDIPKVRELVAMGQSYAQVGARFGVSRWAIGDAIKGRTWANVGTPGGRDTSTVSP